MVRNIRKILYKSITLIFILSFFCIQNTSYSKATETDFVHSINANYNINENNKASASYSITTTNKVGNNYLQTFTFNFPFEITNISVANSPTPILVKEFKKVENGNFYILTVDIARPVFGLNKSFDWKINFDIQNILISHGMQKAMIIPNFDEETKIGSYTATVEAPKTLGKIAYTYGMGEISELGNSNKVKFTKSNQKTSTFMILFGENQEYFFESNLGPEDFSLLLPHSENFQEVFYTQFPERTESLNENISSTRIDLKGGEAVKGFIRSIDGVDNKYEKVSQEVKHISKVDDIAINTSQGPNSKKARDIFDQVVQKYSLDSFIVIPSTYVDLQTDKSELNPAELNQLYREALTTAGIENRGVYGYVFPIQPFVREEFKTDQHIWTEFWDGEKWISVDPTWFISSKGNDYFGKNSYHHIKFGNYFDISELNSFLEQSKFFKITPLQNPSYMIKDINIVMQGFSDAFSNKNLRFELINKSNQVIKFEKLSSNIAAPKVSISNDVKELNLDKELLPNSKVTLDIPLEYGLLWKDQNGVINFSLDYKDAASKESTIKFNHSVSVRSNISSYLSEFIIGVILLFLLITVVSFVFYKKF